MDKNNIQNFDWGQIEWIYEPDNSNSTNIMHIGITTLLPGMSQTKHVHYGDEQFVYILSGEGTQLIGDEVTVIETGSHSHIDAGSLHETVNTGNKPMYQLLISIPANVENSLLPQRDAEGPVGLENKKDAPTRIDQKIMGIYEGYARSLKIPLSIFDEDDNIIIKGQGYPEYCENKCNIRENLNNCCIYRFRGDYTAPQYPDPSAFICPFCLSVFIVPILFNGKMIGKIKGGHLKTSVEGIDTQCHADKSYEAIPTVPMARMRVISIQLKKLARNIIDYYAFENNEVELGKKDEIIQSIFRHELLLEESLKSTQEKVLSIQINNHFLFNTLNALAGLAVKENAFKTYESIVSLSKMFRYSLKTGSNMVAFANELDYLGDYINLQKLRYSDRLEVNINIDWDIKDVSLPFNCLQPIVENCFIHGFKDKKDKMVINISGRREQGSVVIEISDNGSGMDAQAVEALKSRLDSINSHQVLNGLMMIYSKLQLYYNTNFSFEIFSAPDAGTSVRIIINDKLL
ncbi:MAG: histidine kinase [Pseudomonadota bacterium]